MTEKVIETQSCCGSLESSNQALTGSEQEKARREIREKYSNIAKGKSLELTEEELQAKEEMEKSSPLYSQEELASIPKEANLDLGSGNPVSLANIQQGETVIDLGSGAGIDCFLAANKVGEKGKVIGVDMTSNMIDLARANAYKENYENVEFRLGEIEHLPIADNTADVIISNCVINLTSSKEQVFSEALRVLKPGGRLIVSDIMFAHEIPAKVREIFKGTSGCVSRAVKKEDYMAIIQKVGFEDVEIIDQYTIKPQSRKKIDKKSKEASKVTLISDGKKVEIDLTSEEIKRLDTAILSAHVQATKPL
ncbi:MAG: arsenite methyltransferase [Candidatus Heimdallarchaeota archaeon]